MGGVILWAGGPARYKKAEPVSGSKPVNGAPPTALLPFPSPGSCLELLHGFPQGWAVIGKGKPNESFSLPGALGHSVLSQQQRN